MQLSDRGLEAALARLDGVDVIYTDLDGTMLGPGGSFLHAPDGSPTREPVDALMAARAAGIDVVPVSGRALRGLVGDARILGLKNVIAEMGALIGYEHGREVVRNFGATPPLGDGEMPARLMERTGAVAFLLGRYAGRLEHHTPWSAWRDCTQLFRGRVDTREVDEALEAEGLGWLTLVDNGRLHGGYLGLAPGEAHAYHLLPKGVSKGTAVDLDRARRGIPRERCIAVGDAAADLELAPHVGVLVLVRDAVEEDPGLAPLIAEMPTVAVTGRPMNLGWAEAVRAVLPRA